MKLTNSSMRSGATFLDVLTFVVLLAIAAATVFSIYVLLRPDPPPQAAMSPAPSLTVPPASDIQDCPPPSAAPIPLRSDGENSVGK
ncbi:MAG: hypothetical protein WC712_09975 [Candidatus Brocadiia bacterium]